MSAPRRIGLLGGTFDPIHCGHLDVARAAQRALGLTRLYLIPASVPPHRPQPAASSFHRFAMAAIAVAGVDGWRVSDVELRLPAPSYTAQTLKRFHECGYGPEELHFIVGADAFKDVHQWHDYPAILDAARFVVVSRPGVPVAEVDGVRHLTMVSDTRVVFIDAPTADVSSSAIRRARAEGQPITGMVTSGVQQHIEQHGLYAPRTPDLRPQDNRG